jgi:hypothetical protein
VGIAAVHLSRIKQIHFMNFKSLIIAALAAFSSTIALAGNDGPNTGLVIVPAKGSEVYKLIYKGETAGKVKVNIYNNAGSLIFQETIYGLNGFIRPLNFEGLSSGDYTVEVVDANGKKIEKISYAPKGNFKQVHISRISKEDNKYIVAVANNGTELITINIFDEKNNLVHAETKTISGDFAQVYKLANTSSSYTFKVWDKAGNTKTIVF